MIRFIHLVDNETERVEHNIQLQLSPSLSVQILDEIIDVSEARIFYRKYRIYDPVVLIDTTAWVGHIVAACMILSAFPNAKVVIFSDQLNDVTFSLLKSLGVLGFLNRDGERDELASAILNASNNKSYYDCKEYLSMALRNKKLIALLDPLTPEEKTVLYFLSLDTPMDIIEKSFNKTALFINWVKNSAFTRLNIKSMENLHHLANIVS